MYDELSIIKNKTTFSGYSGSYEVEIVDKKDVIIQLKSSEISINDLFKDLLVELDDCFNEIIYKVENWISHGSGRNFDYILCQYLNISSYCKLPKELQHSKKGLINIQNNDNKCFLWCHVRYLNCSGKNLWRINEKEK